MMQPILWKFKAISMTSVISTGVVVRIYPPVVKFLAKWRISRLPEDMYDAIMGI